MPESHDYRMLIAGELVRDGAMLDVINPATARPFAQAPRANAALLDRAVDAACDAFPAWAGQSWAARAAMLSTLADRIEGRSYDLSRLLTLEQGKPLGQAQYEVAQTIGIFRFYAAMTPREQVYRETDAAFIAQDRGPLGVVAAITPWNFPLALLAVKLAPALLVGNCVIAKPAPTTPLTTLLVGELCADIFPAGVIATLVDANDLGDRLTGHPRIAKVAFTGSTATGRRVMAHAAITLKRLTLELGGNDPAIVLDDAPVAATAAQIYSAAMVNSGQVCMAIKRVYVPDALYDEMCDGLAALARAAIVGDGLAADTQLGPLQNEDQFARAKAFLDNGARDGTVIAGGTALPGPGYFIAPTIIRDIDPDARLVHEEQFAPILPVLRYANLDAAIAAANDSEFGLGASVWGADIERATAVARRVAAGTVWVNTHLALDPEVPYRGSKQSGFGAEFGREGLEEFTQARIINVQRTIAA